MARYQLRYAPTDDEKTSIFDTLMMSSVSRTWRATNCATPRQMMRLHSNFALQEYTGESEPPKSELLVRPIRLEDGYLIVPEGPGLGIELSEEAITRYPFKDKILETPLGIDGSVADR